MVERNIPTTTRLGYIHGMTNKHIGSSLDDLLREEGVLEEFQAKATLEVAAMQSEKPNGREPGKNGIRIRGRGANKGSGS